MPTTNKRVNLTLTDEVYEKLQEFKKKNGLISDATACLQLVVKQLQAQETSEQMLRLMQNMTLEQINEMSSQGMSYLKGEIDKKKK
jgi:predicted CopG family antitoxin